MMTMPGVGTVVAQTVRSVIDDPSRFCSSRDIGPWAGLTPRREQSVKSIVTVGDSLSSAKALPLPCAS
ncbi:transposase [Sulfitobacter sp. M22]|uniref:transposase n=1 Tax=Sulfitobacter sp. M22 TaxID=2675332 RepID=UPI001F9C38FA|nr:transposase [Sulfitobacter sp. M22]